MIDSEQRRESSHYKNYLSALKELSESEDIKRSKAKAFPYRPKISIITPVYNIDEKLIRLAIESVVKQIYDNWELCIADGGSTKPHITEVLKEYARKDKRIKTRFLSENRGIAGNSNEALSLATGEFIGFLDHDDELAPAALYEVVRVLNENPGLDLIYTDRDSISTAGERFEPYFKPDWSPDTLRSNNYICHFVVIRKRVIDAAGGLREGYDGSQDYDLFLRVVEKTQSIVHIPEVLYHWRSHESSCAGDPTAKMYAYDSAKKALKEHIQRLDLRGEVYDGPSFGTYRIKYQINGSPVVTIAITAKGKVESLKRCIDSILQRSTYRNYGILIVDNRGIEEDETSRFYNELKNNPKIKILTCGKPLSYTEINNYTASQIKSDYLIFLNSDTEIISADWIESMLEFAQRDDVGAVGAPLYFPDDTIQHAGIIVGLGGVAGYPYQKIPKDNIGYMGRIKIIQNLSAVTGDCLMTRKGVLEEVGGFDENYSHTLGDIDLCLKIREKGYLVVYTPHAELYHHESLSRGDEDTPEKQVRLGREIRLFREKWRHILEKGDPYYNPNLSLYSGNFSMKDLFELLGGDIQSYNLYRGLWEKNVQVHKLNTAIWEKDVQIHNLNTGVWEKDAEIYDLNRKVWEKDAQINDLNTGVWEKDAEIYDLNRKVWEKDVQINNLHNTIYEKDNLICRNRGMIMAKKDASQSSISPGLNIATVRILIVSGINGAPFIYRCLNLKEQLYYLGHHQVACKYVHEVIPSTDAQEYDMIILNRAGKAPNIVELIDLCNKNGNIIVYSTDDLVTDHNIEAYLGLDKYMSTSELALFHEGVDWAIDVIKSSDAVIVSTNYLGSQISRLNKNVYIAENAINKKQLEKAERLMPEFAKKKSERNEIILGYFSGWPNDHDHDFAMINEPLLWILRKYDNVKLRVVGYLELNDRFRDFGGKVEQIDFVPFDIFQNFIADVDINLAPLESNPHKRSKSAIKFLEAAILGVPTIASDLEPYNEAVRHLEDGMLCSDIEGWYVCLQQLIEDASLRTRMGMAARNKAMSEHTTVARSNKLKTIISDIITDKTKEKTDLDMEKSSIEKQNENNMIGYRQYLANKYIRGNGIEIGALHNPLRVDSESAKIKYVDRKTFETLREHYPELKQEQILSPDIIGDAEDLAILSDSSQDFVIANHLLEHSPNPVKALKEFHRVVKKYNGIIYLAIPNNKHRESFDKEREITAIEHIVNDYYIKGSERRLFDFAHFWEWVTKVGKFSKFEGALKEARKVYDMNYAIHYHVFSEDSFLSLLNFMRENLNVKFDVLEKYVDDFEFIFILKPTY